MWPQAAGRQNVRFRSAVNERLSDAAVPIATDWRDDPEKPFSHIAANTGQ